MAKREYNGDPLDLSWKSGPWANDGETVAASDDNSNNGTITTMVETLPTPDKDSSKSQIAVYIRESLLNGKSANDLREELDMGYDTVRSAAYGKGAWSGLDVTTPPVKHTTGNASGEWVLTDESNEDENNTDMKIPLDHVSRIRQRLLDGESTEEISEDYDVSRRCVRSAAIGEYRYGTVTSPIPPLNFSGKGRHTEYYIPGENADYLTDEQQQTLAENIENKAEPNAESEEVLSGQSVAKGPQKPDINSLCESKQTAKQGNRLRQVVFAIVALVVGFIFGRSRNE